ncbi:MAG: DUF3990 domain-containing protein [Salinivirgaceae bacterium]|jgi:hypothetical protein|nr:DUF3990 domain-containing protein [Salinivirgaceae bacterium]
MKLYHGSTEIVKSPEILDKQRLLDFGKGFYVTSNKEQAERWAQIKQSRTGRFNVMAYVSVYSLNNKLFQQSELSIKEFTEANEEWLDFVVKNRSEVYNHGYDMVIGPVANDTLYQTLSLYESGILTKQETIQRLKIHPLYNQVAFNTKSALLHLQFKDAFKVAIVR